MKSWADLRVRYEDGTYAVRMLFDNSEIPKDGDTFSLEIEGKMSTAFVDKRWPTIADTNGK
jgi:hypothetical protein